MPLPRPPASWPSPAVAYTSVLVYSTATTPEIQKTLHTPTATTAKWAKVSTHNLDACPRNVVVRPVTDAYHPAHGQHGLFAARQLPAGSFILPYLGLVHTNSPTDTDPSSDYDLSLDRDLGLSIDAASTGNEARFVNDYRGVARGPNAEFRDCWVQLAPHAGAAFSTWERRIGVFVLPAGKAGRLRRGVQPGEEILVNYGRTFWAERTREDAGPDRPTTSHCDLEPPINYDRSPQAERKQEDASGATALSSR